MFGHMHELSEEQFSQVVAKEEEYKAMKQMPMDPLHPVYYHTFTYTLPQEQAYRIVDTRKDKCASNLKETALKPNRRWFYEGWNNFTDFEKQFIQDVKKELVKTYGVDFNNKVGFGPRSKSGYFVKGENAV